MNFKKTIIMVDKIFYRLTLVIALSLVSLSANASYTFNLLDMLGGTSSYAYGINDSGQIVGSITGANGTTSATLWSNGTTAYLDSLGGSYNTAIGINASGQIGGIVSSANGLQSAAIWSNGTLVTTGSSVMQWQGNVINNAGQVVFTDYANGGPQSATVWSNGIITNLSPLTGNSDSQAKAINNASQVVGSSFAGGVETATLWSGGNATALAAVTGYSGSQARAINDSGLVVGESMKLTGIGLNTTGVATLWSNGVAIDLGTLGGTSKANFINASGLIVGISHDESGNKIATLWDGTNIIDLNSFLDANTVNAGWVLKKAYAISDNGWIVGTASNSLLGITSQAFVLAAVPEVNTSFMFSMGLGLFCFMACRRKITKA